MESATYECRRCGACCHGLDVLLTDAEAERFESQPRLLALTRLHVRRGAPPLRFMRREPDTDRCAALKGSLGDCCCGIYAQRPTLCRDFTAGSEECLAARRRSGQEASARPVR
jgi:Fe-S-cluster containining protein